MNNLNVNQSNNYENLFVSYMRDQYKNNYDSAVLHDYAERSGLCDIYGYRWERVTPELWDKVRVSLKTNTN